MFGILGLISSTIGLILTYRAGQYPTSPPIGPSSADPNDELPPSQIEAIVKAVLEANRVVQSDNQGNAVENANLSEKIEPRQEPEESSASNAG